MDLRPKRMMGEVLGPSEKHGAQTPERLILPNIISLCLIYYIILVKPLVKPSCHLREAFVKPREAYEKPYGNP